ncbi:retrovirus-related pol polyprotein from transposon TNT 1-94 [Tanacetum coccineum]
MRNVTGGATAHPGVWSKLSLYNGKVKFEDEDLALLLLTFLPASYEHSVDTLLLEGKLYFLILKDVMATLNLKKIKERSKAVKGDDGEGLYVRGRTDRRDSRQSKGKSRSKSQGIGRLKCYICQSEDHLKRNCLKNNCKKLTEVLLDWIMDSGCSYHMTSKVDIVFYFLECDRGNVLLGDNKECKIRGLGKSGKVKVINGSRVVVSETRRDNCVYSLNGHAVAGELNASVEEKDSLAKVWHKRLGHISEAGLQVLEKQGLFGKKSLCKLDFCENCVLGKSHRFSFGVRRHTTQGVIDYVYSNLRGPSQVKSLEGKRYFLSIVDDYSRRVWVYILSFKHEAFEKFKEWK